MYSEELRQEMLSVRLATIQRAIDYIEGTDRLTVLLVLDRTSIHDHLKVMPGELVRKLRESVGSGHTFGAWKGAQQICQAAGLEY